MSSIERLEDCIDILELLGVLFMDGRKSIGNGVENGDIHCWIVVFCMSTMQ